MSLVGSEMCIRDRLRDSDEYDYSLAWITRSPRFFQMENTKLTLELISPDYTNYFYDLPAVSYTHLTLPTSCGAWRGRGWAGE